MRKDDWRIGSVRIPNKLVLAPMEGVNCAAFRVTCKEYGAGLIYTDMVDTKQFLAAVREFGEEEAIRKLINPQKDERPLVIQLGGGEIEDLGVVAQMVNKHADIIDFNLGCPLGDMLGRKGGVYLMKHPEKLERMLPQLLENATVPVTAKIRSGWDDQNRNAVEIAKLLEQSGVQAIAIHARTRKQRYMARADWDIIKSVKEAVSIPVIGNGDVAQGAHAVTLLGQTGCDAVMIGRAAQGRPAIFGDCLKALAGERYEGVTREEQAKSFHRFVTLYKERESRASLSEIQDHAGWWVAGLPDASVLRQRILKAKSIADIEKIMHLRQ